MSFCGLCLTNKKRKSKKKCNKENQTLSSSTSSSSPSYPSRRSHAKDDCDNRINKIKPTSNSLPLSSSSSPPPSQPQPIQSNNSLDVPVNVTPAITTTAEKTSRTDDNENFEIHDCNKKIETSYNYGKNADGKVSDNNECNPRNKCALKPGHSLMDWIRLGSSGVDLSGTHGAIIKVSHADLAKHNQRDDAWLAIRGKVYNVTRYMDFHPGGIDELMKGVGRDATKIFDDVHAWVNYEQLLSKCFVGPLRSSGMTTIPEGKPTTSRLSPNLNEKLKFPHFKLSHSTPDISIQKSPEHVEIIPRFDWIQKTSDLSIIFYTKSLCNPGLTIDQRSDTEIDVWIFVEHTYNLYQFKLAHEVQWPCQTRNFYETGKIEIVFVKKEPALWTNFGNMERKKIAEFEEFEREYDVINRNQFSEDSYSIVLKPKRKTLQVLPLGYHYSVTARINGSEVTRSYTPVPASYITVDCPATCIPLLIKSYSSGLFSKHITHQHPLANTVGISLPRGNFSIHKLKTHCRIGLLAAGSGITPMLAILDYLMARTSNKLEAINFLLFNRKETDIWCREKLENLSKKDSRLRLRYILSEPPSNWTAERGKITNHIVKSLADMKSDDHVTFSCVCGPQPFNDVTIEFLRENGYDHKSIHCFQG